MINYNGQLYPPEQPPLNAAHHAFRYGEALFESVRMAKGKLLFFGRHLDLLSKGIAALKMDMPTHFTSQYFTDEIKKTFANDKTQNKRIRLTLFRPGGGSNASVSNIPEYLIEAWDLANGQYQLNEKGLNIGILEEIKIAPTSLSFFKSCNATPYVLAGLFKKEKKLDDILLLNHASRLACSGKSNIFIIKENKVFTPPLSEGCAAGVMRSVILELLEKEDIEKKITPIAKEELNVADEVFLTDTVQGIRWVKRVEGLPIIYKNDLTTYIFKKLNRYIYKIIGQH